MTDEQKKAVAEWFAAGASLDEIQKRLKSEFGVHLTYLDIRLWVSELPQPVEKEPCDGEGAAATPGRDGDDVPVYDLDGGAQEDVAAAPSPSQADVAAEPSPSQKAPSGEVEVSVDALMIPGTFASGDVTFSDGKKGKWYVDQSGRLGLGDLPEGYRPNPADAAVFQSKLMSALQAKGLC